MKAKELIKILQDIPKETELNFYLIENDGSEEDTDKSDQRLENLSVIYSAGVEDGHDGEPYLDFGLQSPLERIEEMDDIDRATDDDLEYIRNGKDVILVHNNSKKGVAEIFYDAEMQDREYVILSYTIIYLDILTEII